MMNQPAPEKKGPSLGRLEVRGAALTESFTL